MRRRSSSLAGIGAVIQKRKLCSGTQNRTKYKSPEADNHRLSASGQFDLITSGGWETHPVVVAGDLRSAMVWADPYLQAAEFHR